MKRLTDVAQYDDMTVSIKRKGCLTNDYLHAHVADLIGAGALWVDCVDGNVYLFERKPTCWRIYYYLNNLSSASVIKTPDDRPAMVEIIYRGNGQFPQKEHDFLYKHGFEDHLTRDQYGAVYKDLALAALTDGVIVRESLDINEVTWACDMFNATFDPYSGDFIPEEDCIQLLDNGQILVAVDSMGVKLGALHQTVERNVAWISHVAVLPDARGNHVGQVLLDAFIERNHTGDKNRYMLWVQQQNKAAVSMYKKKGFKYQNKSTLSMILQ